MSESAAGELPLVSVVTPSLNQAAFIEETIRSVAEQDYPRIEHIVVDGGSTDGTLEILQRYGHLRWSSEPDRGQAHAINNGFRIARGDIFSWLNADDLYLPGAVSAAVASLQESGAGLVYGAWRQIDEHGHAIRDVPVRPFDYRELLEVRNTISQPAAFFTRKAFEEVGGLDESLHYALDYDLWLKLGKRFDVRTIDRTLASFRFHPESKTRSSYARFWPETHRVSRRHGGRYFSPMFWRDLPERRPWILRLIILRRLAVARDVRGIGARIRNRVVRRRRR